jgi:hypothetical protein
LTNSGDAIRWLNLNALVTTSKITLALRRPSHNQWIAPQVIARKNSVGPICKSDHECSTSCDRDMSSEFACSRVSAIAVPTDREQAAADYLDEELRSIGLEPEREVFQGSSSYGGRLLIHVLVAALSSVLFWVVPVLSIPIGCIVISSLWVENTTRGVWLSRPLVRYRSANIIAKMPADRPQLRVILSGHYDTQRTGMIWRLCKYLIPLFWWTPTVFKPPLLPLGFVVFGQIVLSILAIAFGPHQLFTIGNWCALGFYAVSAVFLGEWAIGSFVPGAADNATEAAAVLTLGEAVRSASSGWNRGLAPAHKLRGSRTDGICGLG